MNSRNDSVRPLSREKQLMHIHEVRPRKDHRGVDLISDALPSRGPKGDRSSGTSEPHATLYFRCFA